MTSSTTPLLAALPSDSVVPTGGTDIRRSQRQTVPLILAGPRSSIVLRTSRGYICIGDIEHTGHPRARVGVSLVCFLCPFSELGTASPVQGHTHPHQAAATLECVGCLNELPVTERISGASYLADKCILGVVVIVCATGTSGTHYTD